MEHYTTPVITELGTVEALTAQAAGSCSFDKIGKIADQFTPQDPTIDGKIVQDPSNPPQCF